jgi:hypothetical protein
MRAASRVSAGLIALGFAVPAAAQEQVGAAAVAALTGYCEEYFAGTPYQKALVDLGFEHDAETGEYLLGPLMIHAPFNATSCIINVLYAPEEYPGILSAVGIYARQKRIGLRSEREYRVDATFQSWTTGWIGEGVFLAVTELKDLDGTPITDDFDGIQIYMETNVQ